MSMLAGPRRKQKVINLRAKNNAWSNDKSKFGQRMLEKMGWSEGRGLGAKENGIVEHVVAKYKCDEKGLGYVDRNDQWTKHEDDFNALLSNLSNGSVDSEQSQEVLHSGKSLESKSKKSKARIHYHKFTRGKDLSRYSEKDLANIFGKKTFKSSENNEPTNDGDSSEKVFTEKGSMYDYFKNKLANLKTAPVKLSKNSEDEDIRDHSFQGFSETIPASKDFSESGNCDKIEYKPFSFYNSQTEKYVETENSTVLTESADIEKKRKKKKKSKNIEDVAGGPQIIENIEDSVISCEKDKKNKKSKKRCVSENIDYQGIKKKKHKNIEVGDSSKSNQKEK